METKTKQVKEKQKITENPVRQSIAIDYTKPTLSFIGSFAVMVGIVLGVYWYGKQLFDMTRLVFRPISISSKAIARTIDPLDLFDLVKKKDLVLLDIRSKAEYDKEHIKGALSLPSYTLKNNVVEYLNLDPDTVSKLDKSRYIVIYGPSTSFQYTTRVMYDLQKHGYAVSQLAVGWNELRHFQNIWIPEGLWGKIDVNSIIENNDIK